MNQKTTQNKQLFIFLFALVLGMSSANARTVGPPIFDTSPSDAIVWNAGTLSGNASGGAISYQWQVLAGNEFSDIDDGDYYANSTTSSLSILQKIPGINAITYRLAATNTYGTSYSESATITFGNSWTGAVNANWSEPGNWSCNTLPDEYTDVVINPTDNSPVIDAVVGAYNIHIASAATLTMADFTTLFIYGEITSLGIFSAGAPNTTVAFYTSTATVIPPGTYHNMYLGGANNKTLSGNTTANGVIYLSTGTKLVLGDHNLTLNSNPGYVNLDAETYFVTNGTGSVKYNNVEFQFGTVIFPIGTFSSLTPVFLNNFGTADNFSARVIDGVFENYDNETPVGSAIVNKVVNKTWFINEDVPGESLASIVLEWNDTDEMPGFDRSSVSLSHYKDGKWLANSGIPAQGQGPFGMVRNGITSFSPFGVGMVDSPLPVTLVSFDGVAENSTVSLSWKISDPLNFSHFNIEKSTDGKTFKSIGTENQHPGILFYSFTDANANFNALQKTLYYRLKMIDHDGSFAYSRMIHVKLGANVLQTAAYPNPFRSKISIPTPGATGVAQLSLKTLTGIEIFSGEAAIENETAETELGGRIPSGIYLLTVSTVKGSQTLKIVKE